MLVTMLTTKDSLTSKGFLQLPVLALAQDVEGNLLKETQMARNHIVISFPYSIHNDKKGFAFSSTKDDFY